MLRRKPTSIKLHWGDVTEYENLQKEHGEYKKEENALKENSKKETKVAFNIYNELFDGQIEMNLNEGIQNPSLGYKTDADSYKTVTQDLQN